eukprot:832533-Rhodomonas_salina.2
MKWKGKKGGKEYILDDLSVMVRVGEPHFGPEVDAVVDEVDQRAVRVLDCSAMRRRERCARVRGRGAVR